MICSNCNTMNADGVKFCGNCGAPLGMAQPGPQTQQAQGQPQMHPQMQPEYGRQMQPGYVPPAGNGKGSGGLKAVLIAVCALLAVAVVALALVLTGVIGPKNSDDGKTDVASSEQTSARAGRSKSRDTGSGKSTHAGTSETTQDTDPEPDGTSLPEPYKPVLQLFRNALNGMDVTDAMPEDAFLSYEFTSCMYDLPYAGDMNGEEDGGYGYVLADLDKNGVEELLIGRTESYTSVHTEEQQTSSSVIAVFTLSDGEDVQAIPVLFGFLRSTYYLTKDNTFAHYGSMGAMDAYAGEWALDHTDIVQQGDGVRVYADFESDDYEAAFYRLPPGADLYDFDETNRIAEEEYAAYLERLEGKHTAVSFQKIESSYGVEAWTFSPGPGA